MNSRKEKAIKEFINLKYNEIFVYRTFHIFILVIEFFFYYYILLAGDNHMKENTLIKLTLVVIIYFVIIHDVEVIWWNMFYFNIQFFLRCTFFLRFCLN